MKYLLDTNVCIKILKGNSENIQKKISTIKNTTILIPSIVRFELYYGAYKSTKIDETLLILEEFLKTFEEVIFDSIISKLCGQIRAELDKKGTPIGPYDILIGATALSKNYTLVTHNTKEFSRIKNLKIEDWEK